MGRYLTRTETFEFPDLHDLTITLTALKDFGNRVVVPMEEWVKGIDISIRIDYVEEEWEEDDGN